MDERTIYRPRQSVPAQSASVVPLRLHYELQNGEQCQHEFRERFVAGRDRRQSNLILDFENVSRRHFMCRPDHGGWWIEDLDSANGTYLIDRNNRVSRERLTRKRFTENLKVRIGQHGPVLELLFDAGVDYASNQSSRSRLAHDANTARAHSSPDSPTEFIHRYLEGESRPSLEGEVIRQAVNRVSRRRSRKYKVLIGLAALAMIGLAGVVAYKQQEIYTLEQSVIEISDELESLKSVASTLFYEMRRTAANVGNDPAAQKRLIDMESQYDGFLDRLGFENASLSEEERLILKMARVFGECELEMPKDFLAEVKRYIGIWQKTDTLKISIERAQSNGYVGTIREKLVDHYLPPQFFYIGLQESAYNHRAVGPETRWGIAKGVWQFIPDTAARYGLAIGPLREERAYDERDERFDFAKATDAAARYLSDIYSTEAQASGLLVVASYNWGENRVRKRVRELPNDPRERNFWNFLKHYDMPSETRDYVLRIFSAAVIGEDPALFGFDFINPLANSS